MVRECSTLDDGLTLRVRASFSEEGRVPIVRKRQRHLRRPVLAPSRSSPAEPLYSKRAHRSGVWARDEPLSLDATGLFHWCRQRTFQEALLVRCSLLYLLRVGCRRRLRLFALVFSREYRRTGSRRYRAASTATSSCVCSPTRARRRSASCTSSCRFGARTLTCWS